MAYILLGFSSWAVGILNGYNKDNKPLDAVIPYSILSMTDVIATIKVLGTINKPISWPLAFTGSFMGATIVTGCIYCTGNLLGKAIKHTINTL
jgi:hypothetical protein